MFNKPVFSAASSCIRIFSYNLWNMVLQVLLFGDSIILDLPIGSFSYLKEVN